MTLNTLEEVLVDHLRDLYDAEKNLVRALPKMAKAADSEELADAIRDHLEQTKHQVERLEQAFEHLDQKPRFQLPMMPFRSLPMIASSDDSMMAAKALIGFPTLLPFAVGSRSMPSVKLVRRNTCRALLQVL